jgi:hypothetical protein
MLNGPILVNVLPLQSYGAELLREFSFHAKVEVAEVLHVRTQVTGRHKSGAKSTSFTAKVEERGHNGYACLAGNMVKARLPVCRQFACTLRRNNQYEMGCCPKYFDHCIDYILILVADNRHPAQCSHNPARRGVEQAVFCHPGHFNVECGGKHQQEREVPVGRVGCCDENIVVAFGTSTREAPASDMQQPSGEPFFHESILPRGRIHWPLSRKKYIFSSRWFERSLLSSEQYKALFTGIGAVYGKV